MAGSDNIIKAEIAAIRMSGLFLSDWYLQRHPEVAARGEDGLVHFCQTGWREGAQPNPYFDPAFYLQRNPDIAAVGLNPLVHYAMAGDLENRDPSPNFHVAWYRQTYGLGPKDPALRHYLERRLTGQVNPVPLFNAAWYLETNDDVAAAQADPFEHFLAFGPLEMRDPAPDFDIKFYLNRYAALLAGQNPLLHYLAHRDDAAFQPVRPEHEKLIPGAVRLATRPAAAFEEFRPVPGNAARRAKLLAYYLPQFHHVAENDAWWGKGFTDWTNLGRALPRYVGHLQPRVPRDLGFYSMDDPATLRQQIEMAKGAGLFGFVFYYYWFNGHRLLEKPLEQLLGDATLDFPFCAMWANENWTRRWDGLEREVLIAQEYRERDDEGLVASFARLFADPRYIRVAGRPLLMIYRVSLIPDAARRIRLWREMFRARHDEDPVIIVAQSLGDYDPAPYGLDGAIEFPPHKLSPEADKINNRLDVLDPDFTAAVYEYQDIAEVSLATPAPNFPLIKTIVPGWDNDPRREGQGLVLHDATPAKYQAWLEKLVRYAEENPFFGEPLICVNAWNEWAEGAFLEPDLHYGAAFLNATGRALCARDLADLPAGILLIGHDAQPHGSQLLLLHIARRLRRQWGITVHLLLLGVGPLLGKYYETAQVSVAYDKTIIGNLLDKYHEGGIRTAIVNSAASARVVPWLEARGFAATLLVHEMPRLLQEHNLEIQAKLGGAAASNLVFSSAFVRERFCRAVDLPAGGGVILPQGNYLDVRFDAAARARVRKALGVVDDEFLVLGVGFADLRKGFDLFLQMARALATRRPRIRFLWVGELHFTLKTYFGPEIEAAAAAGAFQHIGFTDAIADYFAAADIYALSSREDPLPTVVLEALACGVPAVAFAETGGIPDLLRELGAGVVAKLGDTETFMAGILQLADHAVLEQRRPALAALAAQKFDFSRYVENLLRLAQPALKTVTACVLSYNYADHIGARLESVFNQSYPIGEILLLDDASSDDSVARAKASAAAAGREMTVIVNETNSGSVFAQWRRAALAAKGEYIWLAEADDESAPHFIERLIEACAAADAPVLAFADSKAIDEAGAVITRSYRSYYVDSDAAELGVSGVRPADAFARKFLVERNLILNVSAVLWRREALLAALDACADIEEWRVAGDWRLYLEALGGQTGSVVYVAEPLNTHRRHGASVTKKLDPARHLAEIRGIHQIAARKFALPPAATRRQAEYAERVAEYLKEPPEPAPKAAAKGARKAGAPPRRDAAIVARKR